MAELSATIGTADYNDIFAGATPTPHIQTVKLAGSQGVLERGTIVTGTPGKTFSACSATTTGDQTSYVLAEDTDTGSSEIMAHVYTTGFFRREALKTDGEYELTAADIDKLRGIGILTTESL